MNNISIILFLGISTWLSVLTLFLVRTISHYKKLVEGTNKRNLIEILDKILERLSVNRQEIEQLKKELGHLISESAYFISKVGLLRFNPFSDTGGDQSFVLTILDSNDTGIVLTSLHSRGITRWYAKKVSKGKGMDHELSKEEIRAIKEAIPITTGEKLKRRSL